MPINQITKDKFFLHNPNASTNLLANSRIRSPVSWSRQGSVTYWVTSPGNDVGMSSATYLASQFRHSCGSTFTGKVFVKFLRIPACTGRFMYIT
ncbi:unnamed protein product [Victoria cruziana]